MRMMNPSVIVSRLDLVVLELAVAGIVFRRLPLGAPRWVVPPLGHPLVLLWRILGVLVHKHSPKSIAAFGLHLILIPCGVKNKQKTATGTRHYVNRLVPKKDIKLL